MSTNSHRDASKKPIDFLKHSAVFWFVVTSVGQWLFVAYIAGYYGARFFKGGVSGFEGIHLSNGFIQGDHVGNSILAIHVLIAGLIIAAGQLQLIPAIRQRLPRLHRYSGWFYMIASLVVSVAGIYLVWSRDRAIGSLIQDIGVTLSGVLVIVFVPIALYYAIKRDFSKHRQWALRLFMVVSAVWFLRIMTLAWIIITGGVGINLQTFSGPFLYIAHFAQYLIPLAVLELYFWAQRTNTELNRRLTACVIFVGTVAMIVGIVGVTLFLWIPYIGQ